MAATLDTSLYLEQVGQKQRAQQQLRKAYTLNSTDEQNQRRPASAELVPGPGLKDESALVKPQFRKAPCRKSI